MLVFVRHRQTCIITCTHVQETPQNIADSMAKDL